MDRLGNRSSKKEIQIERDEDGEAAYVKQIVKTRGEGLSDVLNMKEQFDKTKNTVSQWTF